MSIAFFDVDETLITGKSMFLFLHRYAAEYPLQCGLTAAAARISVILQSMRLLRQRAPDAFQHQTPRFAYSFGYSETF